MGKIIQSKKSVIVAADVPNLGKLANLAEAMVGVNGIGGFKLGLTLAMQDLSAAVSAVRRSLGPNFPIIYDHQKAGNDIPDMGKQFAEVLKNSGVDAAILFPFAGPATQEAWTKACFDAGLQVLTGGVMTHPQFLVSEDGYIADESVERIYRLACKLGVRDFVVPGNKKNWVNRVRSVLVKELGEGSFVLYAPGFITQKGDISECGQAAGNEWHAIVGSAIYKQATKEEQRQAAIAATSQLAA
jgi:orotidine-5'-phosphate decarboxylase